MPRKSIEEHLLAMVQKWRGEYRQGRFDWGWYRAYGSRTRTLVPPDCVDDLEEFVHCHPELKDVEL